MSTMSELPGELVRDESDQLARSIFLYAERVAYLHACLSDLANRSTLARDYLDHYEAITARQARETPEA